MCRSSSAVQEHCPPEKLFATRYSPFAVVPGSAEASPYRFFSVPRPTTLAPLQARRQASKSSHLGIKNFLLVVNDQTALGTVASFSDLNKCWEVIA